LALLKKPALELSDLTKVNSLRMMMVELTLAPAYSMRVLADSKGRKTHRYRLQQPIDCYVD
jgi:hypothetical protein